MFWFENVFFILIFMFFEIIIMPVAYIKVWINLAANSVGILKTILNCFIWALIGLLMIFFLVFRDVAYLIKILAYH